MHSLQKWHHGVLGSFGPRSLRSVGGSGTWLPALLGLLKAPGVRLPNPSAVSSNAALASRPCAATDAAAAPPDTLLAVLAAVGGSDGAQLRPSCSCGVPSARKGLWGTVLWLTITRPATCTHSGALPSLCHKSELIAVTV